MASARSTQDLLNKIQSLPSDKIAEVEDFVEFLVLKSNGALLPFPRYLSRHSARFGTIPTMPHTIGFEFADVARLVSTVGDLAQC